MATTYSTNLRLSLMGTGENTGTWGTVTNTNLGTLLEQSIVGAGSVAMADANQTISITDGASSTARCLFITCTGAMSAGRNLVVPAINKNYVVYNNTTGGFAVTVKTASGTGIAVGAGLQRLLYVDGTNVIEQVNSVGAFTITGALTATAAAASFGAVTGTTFNKYTLTTPATGATLTIADGKTLTANNSLTFAGTDGNTLTFPSGNDTVVTLTGTQTLTNKTLTSPALTTPAIGSAGGTFAGATSGTTTVVASAVAIGTLTLPAATDTLVGKATTDTLTNKTLTSPTINTGALGGASTATTQAAFTNSTLLATTAYADRIGVQQTVSTQTGAVNTGTTTVPLDDTIPQNTEGDEYMTRSITPKSTTSTLIIEVVWNGASNVGGGTNITVALFQDTTADALKAVVANVAANAVANVSLRHVMTSGTTSATTFKVRAGAGAAGTTTFNGAAGGRYFGGVMASSIVITEVGS